MEQFDLSLWLKDKSSKVKTRRGNPVRIICTDRKHGEDDLPIVFLEESNGGEFLLSCRADGTCDNYDTPYDLFFADEELTEFEKEFEMMMVSFSNGNLGSDVIKEMPKQKLHNYACRLLDLARKELIEELSDDNFAIDFALNKGKQDALKDLPKWKKATEHLRGEGFIHYDKHNMTPQYADTNVEGGEYYLNIDDLKTLPKEE